MSARLIELIGRHEHARIPLAEFPGPLNPAVETCLLQGRGEILRFFIGIAIAEERFPSEIVRIVVAGAGGRVGNKLGMRPKIPAAIAG